MGLFENLGLEVESDIEVAKDVVSGTGGFAKIENTGMYIMEVEKAYAGMSDGGAYSVTAHLVAENGAKLTITEYITSGTAKGQKNYYLDKNGKKQFLPGYNKIKNLDALLGFDRVYPKTNKKKIMLWDYNSKAELPVEKEVIEEWTGKKVGILLVKRLEDKYNNPAEFVTKFEVEHFIDPKTFQTRNEKVAGLAGFKDKWLEANGADKVIDKREHSKNAVATPKASSTPTVTEDDEVPFSFGE